MKSKQFVVLGLGGVLVLTIVMVAFVSRRDESPARSTLSFVGVQAGAQFEANFQQFSANIDFDPQDLGHSRFDVTIDTTSATSNDEERDSVMRGPDLLATGTYPTAHYVADKFSVKGDGRYTAAGKLTLRDVTREVPVEFTYESSANGTWLKGSAALERLDFGIGQGEWQDTTMVANEVAVRFEIKLEPPT